VIWIPRERHTIRREQTARIGAFWVAPITARFELIPQLPSAIAALLRSF
jgi:hypothetical protein